MEYSISTAKLSLRHFITNQSDKADSINISALTSLKVRFKQIKADY
jgi:hypothetical protein